VSRPAVTNIVSAFGGLDCSSSSEEFMRSPPPPQYLSPQPQRRLKAPPGRGLSRAC
jgi:hypothetical protein